MPTIPISASSSTCFHTLARGLDPDSIRSVPKDRIFLVQLADAPAVKMDYLSWSRHLRMMPGQGDLDVVGFMARGRRHRL